MWFFIVLIGLFVLMAVFGQVVLWRADKARAEFLDVLTKFTKDDI